MVLVEIWAVGVSWTFVGISVIGMVNSLIPSTVVALSQRPTEPRNEKEGE